MSLAPPPPKTELESPTNVRYIVLALTVAMSLLLYLHRYAFTSIGPTIKTEFGIDDAEFGLASSVFFWAYALCQIPAGLLADKIGGRIVLSLCVLSWSVVLMAMGFAHEMWVAALCMGLIGVSQAAAYPTAAGILKTWMPATTRGLANGMVTMGGRCGGLLTSFGTPLLVVYVLNLTGWSLGGWRVVFFAYGTLGLLWTIAFWFLFRDRPEDHPRANEAECELIAAGKSSAAAPPPPTPWGAILTSPNLWLISGVNFFQNIAWIFLAAWPVTYLNKVYGVAESDGGKWAALIAFCGMLGNIVGGYVTDYFVKHVDAPWGRRMTGLIGPGIACALYGVCFFADGLYTMIALFAAIWFFLDFELSARWGVCQDFGGRHVATIVGFANMCGNLGAAIFTATIGQLGKAGKWEYLFAISCGALILTMLCWLFLDPRVSVAPEEEGVGK